MENKEITNFQKYRFFMLGFCFGMLFIMGIYLANGTITW